jgi:hypothetical protein
VHSMSPKFHSLSHPANQIQNALVPESFLPSYPTLFKYVALNCCYVSFVYDVKALLDLLPEASTIWKGRLRRVVGLQ